MKEQMRSKFEKLMRQRSSSDLTINRFGNYRSTYVQNKWNDFQAGWQAALSAVPAQEPQHQDDIAIDRFAEAMKAKMAKQREKGYSGWDDKTVCSEERLQGLLLGHVAKGDPVDVGNFAMMLFNRGEQTQFSIAQQPAQEPSLEDRLKYSRETGNAFIHQPAQEPVIYFDNQGNLQSRVSVEQVEVMLRNALCKLQPAQEPVYQLQYATGYIDITEEQYFRESYMRGTPRRIVYPAAALKALQNQIETAVNRIKDLLQDDDGQAHKEARKFIESLSAQKGIK